jgi:hypothetical protein
LIESVEKPSSVNALPSIGSTGDDAAAVA